MVSPRRTIDVENRREQFAVRDHHTVKNELLLKPVSVPLGDVRNTLGTARQLLSNFSGASKKEASKLMSESLPGKLPDDSAWNSPLCYSGDVEDLYLDIIPLDLQLTDDDLLCLALNNPGPPAKDFLYEDDEISLMMPIDSELQTYFFAGIVLEDACHLESDDDLPPVPMDFD